MPNIKSAIKRVDVAERNRERNRYWKSTIRTATNRVEDNLDPSKAQEAAAGLSKAYEMIDKAVAKGILHKNTANRKKSRLALRLAKATSAK